MSELRKFWSLYNLRRNVWRKPEQLLKIQEKKLRMIIKHSYENVEYYHKKFDEELASWIDFGSSPRGSIALDKCSRVVTWMNERDFVTPDDVKSIAHDVLRHRILLSFEATAEGIKADDAIDRLLQKVAVS